MMDYDKLKRKPNVICNHEMGDDKVKRKPNMHCGHWMGYELSWKSIQMCFASTEYAMRSLKEVQMIFLGSLNGQW